MPIAGEPTRRAVGIVCSEGLLVVTGEPIWRGDGTPSMAAVLRRWASVRRACYEP